MGQGFGEIPGAQLYSKMDAIRLSGPGQRFRCAQRDSLLQLHRIRQYNHLGRSVERAANL